MRSAWAAVALVAQLAVVAAPAADEAALERPAEHFDRAAHASREHALHTRLIAEQVVGGFDTPLIVGLTDADRAAMGAQPSEGRLRVGIVKPLGVVVDFADLPRGPIPGVDRKRGVGAIRGTRNGGYVWTAVVESADARGLRLHLANVHLPEGAALWVYNPAGRARGPYTGAGPSGTSDFWTHTIEGPTLVLQLEVPAYARGGRAPTFDIDEVGHLGPGFLLGSNLCAFNAACVENAACATIPAAIEDARNAVALIEFVSGAFLYFCSGGLLADTDAGTQIPYFLTANHCLDREREADSVEAFFQFSTTCGGPCVDPDGVAPSTLGSDLVATDKATDFTLLELNESAPSGSAFLGWTSTPVAFTNGVPLFRISHPAGAPQAYSEHVVDTSRPTCQSWPRGNRIYSSDLFGATEGGSSGSPVLNAAGQVVGQLSGACGTNVNDVCDAASNATVDGAFAAYFSEVQPILDPSGSTSTTSTSTSSSTSSTTSSSTSSTTTTSTSTSSSTSSTVSTSSSSTTSVSTTVPTSSTTSTSTSSSTSSTTTSSTSTTTSSSTTTTPTSSSTTTSTSTSSSSTTSVSTTVTTSSTTSTSTSSSTSSTTSSSTSSTTTTSTSTSSNTSSTVSTSSSSTTSVSTTVPTSSTTSTSTSSSTSSTTTSSTSTTTSSSTTTTPTSSSTTTSTSTSSSSTTSVSTTVTTSSTTSTSTPSSTSSTSSTMVSTTSTTTSTLPAGCNAVPIDGCRTPRKAVLAIREQRVGKERLAFGARRFESGLPFDELGDPVGGDTAYRLCIYDAADHAVGRLSVDRGRRLCGPKEKPCWKAIKADGYAYRDATSSADGVERLVVVAGSLDAGSVRLKAANAVRKGHASLPTGIATALEGNERATVQLVTSDAGCVSVALERVKKAEGSIFKATRP